MEEQIIRFPCLGAVSEGENKESERKTLFKEVTAGIGQDK